MINEIWRDVPDAEGVYAISNLGSVKRLIAVGRHNCHKPGLLTPTDNGDGYLWITIRNKRRYVHILVALAFIGPKPFPRAEVNHKDGNTFNNRHDNLEWTTRKGNARHWVDVLGGQLARGEESGRAKLTDSAVREMREMYATGKYRFIDLAEHFGVSANTALMAVHRKTWRHVL